MNKKYSSNNSILLVLSGLVAVFLIVLIIFSLNKINKINDQIAVETKKLEENKQTLEMLKELELLRPELESANDILKKQIPDQPYEHGLIEYIHKLSENNKNNFVEIVFNERKKRDNLSEMPFSLIINGKYSSLLGLLDSIENGERLIRIDEIRIDSTGDGKGTISTFITANTFYK
jgi:Tfp pilus assembly protein PilO